MLENLIVQILKETYAEPLGEGEEKDLLEGSDSVEEFGEKKLV